MLEVLKRKKDIHFSSRHHSLLRSLCEIHTLQHKIHKAFEQNVSELSEELLELSYFGHPSALNFVSFQYKDKPYDLVTKDFEFSYQSIQERYEAGLNEVQQALLEPTWLDLIDDDSGIVLHQF
jgi:NTE family protein